MRLVVNAERRIIWTASASWLRSLNVSEGMGNGNCRREVLSRAHCQARRLCARSVDVSHPVGWRVQFRPRPVRDTGRGRKRQADRAAGFDRFGAVGGGGRIFLRTGAGGGADAAALQAAAGRPDADAKGSQGALLHGDTEWPKESPADLDCNRGSTLRELCAHAVKDWKEGRLDGTHKLYLLNGASRPWEFGFMEELSQFDKELPWFKYVPTVSLPWDYADGITPTSQGRLGARTTYCGSMRIIGNSIRATQ